MSAGAHQAVTRAVEQAPDSQALPSPRERRRTRTKLLIQGEALRLFAEQGYEQTTIEQIADAADISPRTFFRYFSTKEEVVVWDEYDAQIADLLAGHAPDQPVAQMLSTITRQALEGLYRNDRERLLARHRLQASVPALRARYLELTRTGSDLIASTLARGRSNPQELLRLRITAAAVIDIATVALDQWEKDDGNSDLLTLYDTTADALIEGVSELMPSRRTRRTRPG
jgi:AcrR family transcriptional regulator